MKRKFTYHLLISIIVKITTNAIIMEYILSDRRLNFSLPHKKNDTTGKIHNTNNDGSHNNS